MTRDVWSRAVVATVLVATVLRVAGLQSGLWYDEIVTLVISVRQSLWHIVTVFPGVNQHPLYSVLAHVSIRAFGESAWALRLPACLFGIASVLMVNRLGVTLLTPAEAWAAAAVVATSYHHIWFSQNARGYTLLGFLTLYSTHVLLRAGRTGRPRDYALYALACALGIYTHLTMALLVAGHAIVILGGHLARWRPVQSQPVRPFLRALVGAGVLSALAYAPFAVNILTIVRANEHEADAQVATVSWAVGETIRSIVSGAGVPAALAGGLFAAVGAVSFWRRQPLVTALLLVPGLVTALAVVVLGQPFRPRFFFFLSGAAAIFLGRGVGLAVETFTPARGRLRSSWRTAGVVLCTVALAVASAPALARNYEYPKQDFDGAVQFLDAAAASGARIVAASAACRPFAIYYGKSWTCLDTDADWRAATSNPARVLVAYTLAEYVFDPTLRDELAHHCPVVRRFTGTLGGGDIVVCEASR